MYIKASYGHGGRVGYEKVENESKTFWRAN